MQTRSLAAKGGNHIVASAGRIYNELAATRPDVLKVLANPKWHFDQYVLSHFMFSHGLTLTVEVACPNLMNVPFCTITTDV